MSHRIKIWGCKVDIRVRDRRSSGTRSGPLVLPGKVRETRGQYPQLSRPVRPMKGQQREVRPRGPGPPWIPVHVDRHSLSLDPSA